MRGDPALDLDRFHEQLVRVTDVNGRVYTGKAEKTSPPRCLCAFQRVEEEGLRVGERVFFPSEIARIEALPRMAVLRATETWQQAGAYYVRIQAMAKKHRIALRREFDAHDGPETKYIVVTDEDFPIATARMYPPDETAVMIGRVVVLPEYRRQGIGTMVVLACEEWAKELGYARAAVESRDNKVDFYLQLGYTVIGEPTDGDTFRCIRMEKAL